MLAERFAMIGEHDDERGVELSRRAKALEKPAELRVGERHFVVIRIGDSLFGRAIRRVRVEQVHPCEPGASGWGLGASRWGYCITLSVL